MFAALVHVHAQARAQRPDIDKTKIPVPPPEVAAKYFLPTKDFSLRCLLVQEIIDAFFCGLFALMLTGYIQQQRRMSPGRRDRWATQCVVAGTAVMAFVVTGYLTWFVSYLFVERYGDYSHFFEVDKTTWIPLLDAITSSITQGFFAHRAFCLTGRNWFILVGIWGLILTSLGAALALKIISTTLASQFGAAKLKTPQIIWLSSNAAADLIITGVIMFGLTKLRTGWAHTDKVLTRLARMTFESQVPPCLIAIAFLIEFLVDPSSFVGVTLQGIQSKLYCVGLLYSLNARVDFSASNVTMDTKTTGVTGMHGNTGGAGSRLGVKVDIESTTHQSFRNNLQPRTGLNETAIELSAMDVLNTTPPNSRHPSAKQEHKPPPKVKPFKSAKPVLHDSGLDPSEEGWEGTVESLPPLPSSAGTHSSLGHSGKRITTSTAGSGPSPPRTPEDAQPHAFASASPVVRTREVTPPNAM